jgi:hypothetical protein
MRGGGKTFANDSRRSNKPMNSLDPRAKRIRATQRSLDQARNSLAGIPLVVGPLARSTLSPATDLLRAVERALESIADAERSLALLADPDPNDE